MAYFQDTILLMGKDGLSKTMLFETSILVFLPSLTSLPSLVLQGPMALA
jgi:hypothetical protein